MPGGASSLVASTTESERNPSIHVSLSKLLGSSKYSDMTIRCGEREFKAHRAIVCSQSRFFDVAFSGGFMEATSQVINLPEDDPRVLERFLQFLYTGTYTNGVVSTWGEPSETALMEPEEVLMDLDVNAGVLQVEKNSEPETSNQTERSSASDGPSITHNTAVLPNAEPDDDPTDTDYESPPPFMICGNGLDLLPPQGEVREEYDEGDYNEFDDPESYVRSQTDGTSVRRGLDGLETVPTLTDTLLSGIAMEESDRRTAVRRLADIRNDLLLPLRLYVMADKYDVPALRLLARNRFYRALEFSWENADSFPEVVDELYGSTFDADSSMRDIVCRLVGNRVVDDEVREKLRPVMEKHGDFAFGVMEHMIAKQREKW